MLSVQDHSQEVYHALPLCSLGHKTGAKEKKSAFAIITGRAAMKATVNRLPFFKKIRIKEDTHKHNCCSIYLYLYISRRIYFTQTSLQSIPLVPESRTEEKLLKTSL